MSVYRKGPIELRRGDYRDVLADVEPDAVITDTPYGARTHGAYREMPEIGRNPIGYEHWTADDVNTFARRWGEARGWVVALTDHGSFPWWESALEAAGRYVFAPIACMEPGARVRLSGDGPSQWSVWACVARPKTREAQRWGALPGGYVVPPNRGWRGDGRNGVTGAKPLWLMTSLVRDYSRPGDLICDPCAGGATTLIAAALEGRRAIGAELDPETFAKACARIERTALTPPLPGLLEERPVAVQAGLGFDEDEDEGDA